MGCCSFAIKLEAAQAGILELINQGTEQAAFLEALLAACVLQQHQDSVGDIHWSRHLLASMANHWGEGFDWISAVTFHLHHWWY